MKKIALAIVIMATLGAPTYALEIEGDQARDIVLSGKVLGYGPVIMNNSPIHIYSVLYEDQIWYCTNISQEKLWVCDTDE